MQNTWQAQGFRNNIFRVACAGISGCVKSTLEASDAESVGRLQFHVTEVLLCRDHFAWQLQEFVCLGSTFSWQAQYFRSTHFKIAKTYWTSKDKRAVNMSFLKDVSQKSVAFEFQSVIIEGNLAEKLRV